MATYKNKKRSKSYTIKTGDTLTSIAKRFRLLDARLAQFNQGVGIIPGNVVTIPGEGGWGATINSDKIGLSTPFGGFSLPMYQSPTASVRSNQFAGKRTPVFTPSPNDWINPVAQGISTLGRKTIDIVENWGTPYRVGMGEVQRYGNYPSTPTNLSSQLPTGRTHPNLMGAPHAPEAIEETAAGGNYQEKLPYGKSYNYAVSTEEIPNPGSAASVKYGDDAVLDLSIAMHEGYGYDYGNYLKWASDYNIQQPASYYNWKSTQGVTRSGQSSQFWEYMQGVKLLNAQTYGSSNSRRRNMKDLLARKRAGLTHRQWLGMKPTKKKVVEEEPEVGTEAVQPYISTSGNNYIRYSAPVSMGLVTWRT